MKAYLADLLGQLPPYLAERVRVAGRTEVVSDGRFVLYWMHNALRGHENPALDVTLQLGHWLKLPVLVYQGLSERYPFASDRFHTFILQGARDVQKQLAARGIPYVFHLERPGHRGPVLRKLASQSAVVVAEDLPVMPLSHWKARLETSVDKPMLQVDTACIVPMRTVGRAYERAFEFRRDLRPCFDARIHRVWVDIEPTNRCELVGDLPLRSIDLSTADLAALIAECDIDHLVGPVPHTVGGSTAGYARWEAFRDRRLAKYARLRNDPLVDATSRLSAYLHFGMVSPFRIAREASEAGTEGAEKFLDELLIWRELAHAFCFHQREHDSIRALPEWARKSLLQHAADPRPRLYAWEQLARGDTDDPLWNAAQRSLLMHGELHNNVRMTWGKTIPQWTADPDSALRMIVDLNHRYALDGRDPASYGGILWCLGLFDRPFLPEQPVLGSVRRRCPQEHARRLDVGAYEKQMSRPLREPVPRVAVIGAGLSGLICARTLKDHGFEVTVVEKSRGVGGRMATRRANEVLGFDHGAQYFTVRDERFRRYVDSWVMQGHAAAWSGRIVALEQGAISELPRPTTRYVGVPGMNAICRHLAYSLAIHFETRIEAVVRRDDRLDLFTESGDQLGPFDVVLCSAPAPQTAELLRDTSPLAEIAASVPMQGCWAGLLAFDHRVPIDLDGAFVSKSPLAWIARNVSKPGRQAPQDTWVLHASPEFSCERLEAPPEIILPRLVDAFHEAVGVPIAKPSFAAAHRWRYALPVEPTSQRSYFDWPNGIGICGDWCGGPRVEGAFLSGASLAGQVLTQVLGPL